MSASWSHSSSPSVFSKQTAHPPIIKDARPLVGRLSIPPTSRSSIPVVALILRPLHRAASSLLVEVESGAQYILRSPEGHSAEAHKSPLFREALGSLLAASLGLPVAEWAPIQLTAGAIYFGSRVPDTRGPLYEYLPSLWITGSDIARQMIRMLVFDHWVKQPYRRQYIAFRKDQKDLRIQFIANSRILSELDASIRIAAKPNPYREAARLGVDPSTVDETVSAIEALSQSRIEEIISGVPTIWVDESEAQSARRTLIAQQARMRTFLREWGDNA